MKKRIQLFFLGLFLGSYVYSQEWESIFNGKDLEGWELKGGNAKFEVFEGTIKGIAKLGTPSTYLCTKEIYSDFILEFEVFLANQLNAGVQFRSEDKEGGGVFGYQCEIDPKKRKWTGGIYDEGRNGWLYPLSRNERSREAFQLGRWNKFRIEAYGNNINTYVNGIHCSRLVDDQSLEGFIGLQIHSIGDNISKDRYAVQWRNVKILTKEVKHHIEVDPSVPEISYLKNMLTEWEKKNGFRLLWDGESFHGWRGVKTDTFPANGWKIEDGILTVLKDEKKSHGEHILTKDQFSDFELEVDFLVTTAANSGIRYFVKDHLTSSGCEYQILDDALHPDAQKGIDGNRKLASLYDIISAEVLSIGAKKDPFKGVGTWNKARIVSKNGVVEHWLNNVRVVEYSRFSQMFKALVSKSKYAKHQNFGRWKEGAIMLHDHHDEVSFRSIKIRELNY